ncbi:MAG: FecR domain-containing protein [Polyangiaceae bacterium]
MTQQDRIEVTRLLSVFAERPTQVLDEPARLRRKDRVVESLASILATPPTPWYRRNSTRWMATSGTLALAAGLALVVGHATNTLRSVPATSPIRTWSAMGDFECSTSAAPQFAPCDLQRTADVTGLRTNAHSRLLVETQMGVKLELAHASTLMLDAESVSPSNGHVELTEGEIDVQVPKLGEHRQFAVLTPTAKVVVHGTAFKVSVSPSSRGEPNTCVELREGVITVETRTGATRLTAPSRFGCDFEARKDTSEVTANSQEAASNAERTAEPHAPGMGSGAVRPRSSLAAETKLLQAALAKERMGDYAAAERSLRTLLSQYPSSVVAPEARAALDRLKSRGNAP